MCFASACQILSDLEIEQVPIAYQNLRLLT